jgi:hypothetical protein
MRTQNKEHHQISSGTMPVITYGHKFHTFVSCEQTGIQQLFMFYARVITIVLGTWKMSTDNQKAYRQMTEQEPGKKG